MTAFFIKSIANYRQAVRETIFNISVSKKLPSMQSLKQEYAMLQLEDKKGHPECEQAREKGVSATALPRVGVSVQELR